ncbi:hypothetical protein EUX98_g7 [Antrodiella citrinella]|uniref:Alginate lyase domain-containing protein n=1 Tax=Antrodiella citrinella TaxID=2447956 RepID=A0A4S4N4R4_9APHY|nr:hypothetical protein EUX98_g7 [Antrodiella citrinella]
MFSHALTAVLILREAANLGLAADPNDWVNINYVLKQTGNSALTETSSARQTIGRKADSTAKDGPFIITASKVKPPSGDIHDYLSWAPYHWPNCDWCSKGSNHFTNPNSTDDTLPDDGDDVPADGDPYDDGDAYDESADPDALFYLEAYNGTLWLTDFYASTLSKRMFKKSSMNIAPIHHRMQGTGRELSRPDATIQKRDADEAANAVPDNLPQLPTPILTSIPGVTAPPTLPTAPPNPLAGTTTHKGVAATQAPAEAHAKTSHDGKAACTPSPTKSLAPSATWTTCPYVVKDGQVNSDVRTLPGPALLQDMPESVLFNVLTYATTKSQVHSQTAAKFIEAFFMTPATMMHPNLNFGQLVRGPGKDHQVGTFTGVLDFRALVKIVNAVQILKASKSSDWTSAREQGLMSWMKTYITWLQTSSIGKETAGKANNHLTFYINQLAAAQMYVGDTKGASSTLSSYFKQQFLDQIAASGEQPFEAVRTRPYHYRAFNLEAMITNAKLGDQLGMNFWTAKSKYGATIQTALDYAIAQKPGKEDVDDIIPHVASIAAAYGDATGKYTSFLSSKDSSYKSEAWYFNDQTAALPNSPAAGKSKRSMFYAGWPTAMQLDSEGNKTISVPDIPFECPQVFNNSATTQLEDGLFVTCNEIKPMFEIPVDPDIISGEEYYGL